MASPGETGATTPGRDLAARTPMPGGESGAAGPRDMGLRQLVTAGHPEALREWLDPRAGEPLTGTAVSRSSGTGGGDGAGREPTSQVAEQQFLRLLQEEQVLLEEFGPDHPAVRSVRARIRAVRDFLDSLPPPPAP